MTATVERGAQPAYFEVKRGAGEVERHMLREAAPEFLVERAVRIEVAGGAHRLIADGDARMRLGDKPIAQAILHDGDVVRIGDDLELVYRNPLAARIAPIQHFATPPGTPLLTIGRSDADIILDQPLVSRRQPSSRGGTTSTCCATATRRTAPG